MHGEISRKYRFILVLDGGKGSGKPAEEFGGVGPRS